MASTSIPHRWIYDVFVSFRGADIRKSFMDHLFKDFSQKGIRAFRDDNELARGEEISPELYRAIEGSMFLLVIFSKNYASSGWCLKELVKILECKQIGEHKHEVRIIFYDVKPNVVRKQTESYAEAFVRHESLNRTETAKWREALSMATDLSGWDLGDLTAGYESKFIDIISRDILKILRHEQLHVGENIVGMDARVDKVNLVRFIGSDKVHMIGICGISGIGKTTLAKAIYNRIHHYFQGSCYCEGVQEKDLTQVQMHIIDSLMKTRDVSITNVGEGIMLIHRISKPILVVLDDVDHRKQLEALAGSHHWFFPGSLIILTSKDKRLLKFHKVDEIYDMEFLDYHEALKLFCLSAFGKEHPPGELGELPYQLVEYLQGHPLALKVLGCSLCNEPIDEWKSQLEELQRCRNKDIQEILRPSFNRLDDDQMRTLLDIACCFIGEKKDLVATVLDRYNCCAKRDIEALVDKSLITIDQKNMSLQMHGLIQSMARKSILDESEMAGMRTRLWSPSEVCDALNENKVTEAVEVLVLRFPEASQDVLIDGNAFAQMKNLRILKFYHPYTDKVKYTGKLKFLSNKLTLFCWHGYPFSSLPTNFYPETIVVIDLSYSRVKKLWGKAKCFERLKVMKLRCCRNLKSTPDFTKIANLEELYLDDCVKLVKVHPSIGRLNRLVVLSMRNCILVKSFRCTFEMESLQVMDLSGCSKVDKFPEIVGTIKNLVELRVDGTAIMELPSFVSSLSNLQVLSFARHEKIGSRQRTFISRPSFLGKLQHPQSPVIPSLVGLCSLRKLNLSYCNLIQVPDIIGGLSCLEKLRLNGNNFTSLPGSLSQLSRLKGLELDGCKKLEVLPDTPHCVRYISATDCTSLQKVQTPLIDPYIIYKLRGCPKLLRNINPIESESESEEVCISSKPQDLDTCNTSHGSRNSASSLISYVFKGCLTEIIMQNYRVGGVAMTFHGCRGGIPEWFGNQSKGDEDVKVELPQSSTARGYGIWAVFTPLKPYDLGELLFIMEIVDEVQTYVPISASKLNHDTNTLLSYTPRTSKLEKAKDFVTFSFKGNKGYEVKEFGVRLICDEEECIDMDFLISMMEELPIHGGLIHLIDNANRSTISVEW